MSKSGRFFAMAILLAIALCGCMSGAVNKDQENVIWRDPSLKVPKIPEDLEKDDNGIPLLDVYDTTKEEVARMDLEEYVLGVVAGEMKNTWPLEALKAQAILARTFVLKFCDTKESQYPGADISTDVSEAQAYAPDNINSRVRSAVEETKGMVMSVDGAYPHAWFYAHAGGKTELPTVALDYKEEDPAYLSVVESPDSEKAPDDVKNWTAVFTEEQFVQACKDSGLEIESVEEIKIGEKGDSGRAKTLVINGKSVSAPTLRIKLGANKLKSTLIESVEIVDGKISFTGSGYGHGVGMSQWGAYSLAEEGKSAEEIIKHYFRNIDIVELW